MSVDDAKRAMDAGAKFIVSPVIVPEVVQWCAENMIVCAPGCQTPTEMVQAWKLGAPIQKLFPGVMGGPNWVKAVSAALPMLRINPTSGVEIDTAADYLRAGAGSRGALLLQHALNHLVYLAHAMPRHARQLELDIGRRRFGGSRSLRHIF